LLRPAPRAQGERAMRDPVRRIVWVLALVALVLRLAFVLLSPPRALYWDEPAYEKAAERYRAAWSLSGSDRAPTLSEAFRGSMLRGEVYAVTVALVYTIFGHEPRAVFVLQSFIDTATCLLLFGLARVVGGTVAGLVALVLATFYEPFIFTAARLQTETLASFLCVAGLWAVCVPQRRRRLALFCAGVTIAAAMLTRPAMQWLFPVLLPAVVACNRDRAWAERVRLAAVFAAGFFALIGPRLILTAVLTGEPVWAGRLDPSVDMYGGAIVGNAGWKTDGISFAKPPRDELRAVLGDPPARHWTIEDMRRATLRTWAYHPLESAAVMLHKLYEAWLHPYNDSRWTFLSGQNGPIVAHRIIAVFALLGIPLSLHRWRVALPLVVATFYVWFTYLVVKIEVRYAVTAMAMMVCFAAVAVGDLSAGWQRDWRAGRRRPLIAVALATVAGIVAVIGVSVERILQAVSVTPELAQGVRVAMLLILIAWLAAVAARLAAPKEQRSTTVMLLAPFAALAALIVGFGWPLAETWREWRCTLTPNGGIARQEFLLPAGTERPKSVALMIDLLPQGTDVSEVVVRVNGQEAKRYRNGLTRLDAQLPRQDYYENLLATRASYGEPHRGWYPIDISPDLVSSGSRIAVEVSLEEGGPGDSLALLGDYSPDPTIYVGPSLISPAIKADTSIYKFLAEGDFRMRRSIRLAGTSQSALHDGANWSDGDLCRDAGRQLGRYRIFLLLGYDRGIAIL
jgi:4-amino-4-deoxy-L-arabinose transferase-like glycosyltransferase